MSDPGDLRRKLADRLLAGSFLPKVELGREQVEFGRYQLGRLLGRGASGEVYLARDPTIGRDVAIKILTKVTGTAPDRFRREMALLASLRHPSVVEIFDAGVYGGRPYFVMEHVEGESLELQKLPLRARVEVLEQVAKACHAAHEQGVVHRDLKPSNILLGVRPVVIDFGIAKPIGQSASAALTQPGAIVGTPAYMAPEQLFGSSAIDARTDVYALGILLYEALSGRLPFESESAIGLMAQIAQGGATFPAEEAVDAPPLSWSRLRSGRWQRRLTTATPQPGTLPRRSVAGWTTPSPRPRSCSLADERSWSWGSSLGWA